MAGNSFGRILRLTSYGESHGPGLGGVLDGCPAGLPLSEEDLQSELDLRKPGQGATATKRKESDTVRILSGVFQGLTTGTPIAFHIANEDQRSRDYGNLAQVFRPGHADWGFFKKFHGIRDYRGGGRSSGRETVARVAAGAIAKKLLATRGIRIVAGAVELGGIAVPPDACDLDAALSRPFFAAADSVVPLWEERVAAARAAGDTLGGVVQVVARNVPAGLGEPCFDKLDARLAYALMGVGAVKAVEVGEGFAAARLTGSQNNDPMLPGGRFASNHAGGILGGISSGQDIVLRVGVKPIASIAQEQRTIDVHDQPASVLIGGRHDLAAIPRIVPVLTAMSALVLALTMGVAIVWTKSETLGKIFCEMERIMTALVNRIMIPILPFFVGLSFLGLAYEGSLSRHLPVFIMMVLIVIVGHFIWLAVLYGIGGALSGRNPSQVFRHYAPAYLTAVGTMSSAATLAVALRCARKSKVLREDMVSFGIPLFANIHLCGSVLTEVFFCMTISKILYGHLPSVGTMILFCLLLGIFAIGAPGVPGGTVMASLGLITGVLMFDDAGTALMLAIFALQDSFGTACNVTGDGALTLMLTGYVEKHGIGTQTLESPIL